MWYDPIYGSLGFKGLNVRTASRTVPLLVSDFIQAWVFSRYFRLASKYEISWKFVQWKPSYSMRADGQNKANSSFFFFTVLRKGLNTRVDKSEASASSGTRLEIRQDVNKWRGKICETKFLGRTSDHRRREKFENMGNASDNKQKVKGAPLYRHWSSVRAVRPIDGLEIWLYSFLTTALEGSEGSVSRTGPSLPPGKTRYPLYRRLCGPQGRSGQVRKISPPPGFDPRTVQPLTIRYTDWATGPTICNK